MPGAHIFGLMIPTFSSHLKNVATSLISYLGIWLLFAAGISVLLFRLGYYDSFLLLNSFRNSFLDSFMPHFTHVGEGVLLASLFSLMIVKQERALVKSLLLALLLMGLLLYLCKQLVFMDWDRPPVVFKYFEEIFYLSLGRERYNSFPSGHSAAIWMIMTFIAFYFRNRSFWLPFLCGLLAASVAFSRVYIGVHFPGDILMGSFIGLSVAMLVLAIIYPRFQKELELAGPPQGIKSLWLSAVFTCALIGSIYFLYEHYYL